MAETVVQVDTDRLTNAFLLRGDRGSVLVDTGNPGSAERILRRLAKQGVSPADVRLILITHGHVDHFGSAARLRELTGAPVAIHALDADAARRGAHLPESLHPTSWLLAFLMHLPIVSEFVVSSRAPAFEPDVAFEEGFRLEPYGVAGRVFSTPGHAPGSVSVLTDGGEAIVGDMVMGKLMGLIHAPGPPVIAWDLERNWESVRRLLDLSPRVVYVGHGGPFKGDDVANLLDVASLD